MTRQTAESNISIIPSPDALVVLMEEQAVSLRCIRKTKSRSDVYHYTKLKGPGYYVTLCGRVVRSKEADMVFTPIKLCGHCRRLNENSA